jgi:hypothetical protein
LATATNIVDEFASYDPTTAVAVLRMHDGDVRDAPTVDFPSHARWCPVQKVWHWPTADSSGVEKRAPDRGCLAT